VKDACYDKKCFIKYPGSSLQDRYQKLRIFRYLKKVHLGRKLNISGGYLRKPMIN